MIATFRPVGTASAERGYDMTTRILVFQHIACEPPGAYEAVLRACGATMERVELDEGEAVPDWRAVGAIIPTGGPPSVNHETALPWRLPGKSGLARTGGGGGAPPRG